MPDGMSYAEFMQAPASASTAPPPQAASPQPAGDSGQSAAPGPVAFPGGGGVLPDGSATQDPAVWQRWTSGQPGAVASGPQTPTATPGSGGAARPGAGTSSEGGMSYDEFMRAPGPATPPPGKFSGLFSNIGAGANDAIAGTFGAPVDAVAGALNLGARGINAITGAHLGQITAAPGGSDSIKRAMGFIGANPDNIVPADDTERLARAGGSGAASMVLPWSIARALPVMGGIAGTLQTSFGAGSAGAQAASGAAAGVGGQVAEDAAPDSLKPLANAGGQLLGGGAMLGGLAGARAALDQGGAMSRRFVDPLTSAGQQRMAGQRIASAATDRTTTLDALNNPQPQLVPGAAPTTFQATADPGLGNLERAVAVKAPDQFNARAAAQNEARVAAVQGLAPDSASPDAVGRAFRAQLDQLDGLGAAAEGSARTTAQAAVDRLGGAVPAGADQQATALQGFGQTMRGGLADANAAAKAQEGRLWQAIDPDNTLTVDMRPVREAASAIAKETPANSGVRDTPAWKLLTLAQLQKAVQPFSELGALRSRISDTMRTELQTNGRTQAYGTLSKLMDAVSSTMQSGVEQQAAAEAHGVASGAIDPEGTIVGRIQDFMGHVEQSRAAATADATGRAGGNSFGASPGASTPLRSGSNRPGSTTGGGLGGSAGSQGLQAGARAGVSERPPPSLLSFLVQRGGIRDEAGELASMDAHRRRVGLVRTNGGLSLDYAREAAEEAGYLPRGSGVNDLLDGISEELHGRTQYPHGYTPPPDIRRARASDDDMAGVREQVRMAHEDAGANLRLDELDHAAELTARGMHPDDALREAARAGDERLLANDTLRRAFTGDGLPDGATQADLRLHGGSAGSGGASASPTFDAAALARYQAARGATADRHATFTNAPGVGAVLKPGRIASEFAMGDSSVPSAIFNSGKGAAERIQAFMRAGGSRPDLVDAVQDYAAFDLRRSAERADGTLDPAKFAKWRDAHAEALSAFPDLAQRFETAASAGRALDAAAASRVAAREAFEKSAASRFLGDADPVASMGRILKSDTALAQMQHLARLTANEPAARAGLQRAVADYMLRDLRSNTVLGGSEVELLKNDAFQTFVRKTPAALAQVFSPEQMQGIRNIAADLQRANRSISGTKLQGGSNTAQDTAAGATHGSHGQSALVQVVIAEAVGELAEHVAGPGGKAFGIASLVVNAMRQSGLKKVDDLVTEAMLHPEIAKTLLMKAPNPGSAKLVGQILSSQLRGLALKAAGTSTRDQPAPADRGRYTGFATPASVPRVSAFMGAP